MIRGKPLAVVLVAALALAAGCGDSDADPAQDSLDRLERLQDEQRCDRFRLPSERVACREEAGL